MNLSHEVPTVPTCTVCRRPANPAYGLYGAVYCTEDAPPELRRPGDFPPFTPAKVVGQGAREPLPERPRDLLSEV